VEWLANLTYKPVLITAVVLLLLRVGLVRCRRESWVVARELVDATLIALVVVFLMIRPFLFQAYYIPSISMRPTLHESDRLLVNKLIYRVRSPHRREIIVFRPPEDRVPEQKDYVKRVIGLPGEVVEVVPDRLMVDRRPLLVLTSGAASENRSQNFNPDQDIGFTFPMTGGAVQLKSEEAVITGGVEPLTVAVYRHGDAIDVGDNTVELNDRPLLSVLFGPIETSTDLAQWGGDPDLRGLVCSVNGTPRLILIEGRRLTLDVGHVIVNGARLKEPYVAEDPAYAMGPLRVPPGHYFVLGDNRNQSFDSHAWGPLDRERIHGRAEILFWPVNRMRYIPGK
jgi:signal peptidase I